MKKILLGLVLLFTVHLWGSGSVQNATYFNAVVCWTGAPCVNTIPSTTQHNALLVYYPSNATAPVITASGATFSAPTNCQQTFASPISFTVALQVAVDIPGGITTVTISGDSNSQNFAILEVTGVTTTPVDACNVGIDTTATSPMNTASVTPTTGNDFVVAFISEYFAGSPHTYGWTAPCVVASTPGTQVSAASKNVVATTSTNCQSSVSNTSGRTVYATIALLTGGGGGGATKPPTLPDIGVGMATLNPDNIVPLIGISSVVAASLPPVGGRNQARYLEMSIDSLLKYGLLVPDKSDDTALTASKAFARNYVKMADGYNLLGFNSPLVDYAQMVLQIETAKGVVNWVAVENDLNIITDFAFVQGWIKPGTAKVNQVKAFMLEFTHIVDAYNRVQ